MQEDKQSAFSQLPADLAEAVAMHQRGELVNARGKYEAFLGTQPKHPVALQLLGLLHSQQGSLDKAIEYMRASLAQYSNQPEVLNNLGNALAAAGRHEEAVQSYRSALQLSPKYLDAWRNLGLTQAGLGQDEDAEKAFQRCLELEVNDAAACLGLANLYQADNDIDRAIHFLERALRINPDFAEAHHNLGVCLRRKHKSSEAISHYEKAISLGLDRAELYQNLGSALVDGQDIDAAVNAYLEAIKRNPEDVISHRNLNKLLWEQDALDGHFDSYRSALDRLPRSLPLNVAYALDLFHLERYEEAESRLLNAVGHGLESAEIYSLLGHVCEGMDNWDRALENHARAIASDGVIADQRVSYARALLATQNAKEALRHAEMAASETPFNQRAIAYLGLCWRMLENPADEFINNYQEFVQVYDVPVPDEYQSAEEFNRQLATLLDSLHLGKNHPPEQTLRGGTQTYGDLFDRDEREIRQLVAGLKACIADYIDRLGHNDAHPLIMRRSDKFEFSASWSVRLQSSGYHTQHIHPLGWISSAYYVQVPAEVSESESHGGGIKFGEPDINLGWRGLAARKIQPGIGQLVLFPSYMWHGTVPFDSTKPRTTVAFDVVPVHDR